MTHTKGLTDFELIELASGKKSIPRTEVDTFFKDTGLTYGSIRNDDRLIYWEYLKWCYKLQRDPVNRKEFKAGLFLRYKRYCSHGLMYYKLNKKIEITKDEWEVLLHDYLLEKEKIRCLRKKQKTRKQNQKLKRREAQKEKNKRSHIEPPKTSD